MGPKHYLLLRRMHMVRRALSRSAPADTTITEVATRYNRSSFLAPVIAMTRDDDQHAAKQRKSDIGNTI